MVVGDTAITAVVAEVFQVYVVAPDAVKFVELPIQTELTPLTETVGNALIATLAIAVDEQPPLFPVTVYEVGAVGEYVALDPVPPPLVQLYADAPDALNVTGLPAHTV